jgi:hypothetical protein
MSWTRIRGGRRWDPDKMKKLFESWNKFVNEQGRDAGLEEIAPATTPSAIAADFSDIEDIDMPDIDIPDMPDIDIPDMPLAEAPADLDLDGDLDVTVPSHQDVDNYDFQLEKPKSTATPKEFVADLNPKPSADKSLAPNLGMGLAIDREFEIPMGNSDPRNSELPNVQLKELRPTKLKPIPNSKLKEAIKNKKIKKSELRRMINELEEQDTNPWYDPLGTVKLGTDVATGAYDVGKTFTKDVGDISDFASSHGEDIAKNPRGVQGAHDLVNVAADTAHRGIGAVDKAVGSGADVLKKAGGDWAERAFGPSFDIKSHPGKPKETVTNTATTDRVVGHGVGLGAGASGAGRTSVARKRSMLDEEDKIEGETDGTSKPKETPKKPVKPEDESNPLRGALKKFGLGGKPEKLPGVGAPPTIDEATKPEMKLFFEGWRKYTK